MPDRTEPTAAASRPQDVLPDHVEHADINGVTVRKGTIAAFLQNAMRWSDPATADADRPALEREIAAAMPALQAVGVFTVFEVRDERLRDFMTGC
jgi:hypothetical protein